MIFHKKLRKDLPAIDIRTKQVPSLFTTKQVKRSKSEQRKIKKELMEQYPDRYFIDDLYEYNSVSDDDFDWIDFFEIMDD